MVPYFTHNLCDGPAGPIVPGKAAVDNDWTNGWCVKTRYVEGASSSQDAMERTAASTNVAGEPTAECANSNAAFSWSVNAFLRKLRTLAAMRIASICRLFEGAVDKEVCGCELQAFGHDLLSSLIWSV